MTATRRFDDTSMGVASQSASPRVRPRDVLLIGAFVVGWSVGRAVVETAAPTLPSAEPVAPPASPVPVPITRARRRPKLRKPVRLAVVGIAAALVLAAAGFAARPDEASAPLVAPAVAAREHALAVKQAEAARLRLLRHLELAGIAP